MKRGDWSGLLTPEFEPMTPQSAKAILAIKFSKAQLAQYNKLAALHNQGRLSEDERDVLMRFVEMGNLLGLLQAKARLVLKTGGSSKRRKSA